MRTYTIYIRTFQGIRNVDDRNKLDEIYDTGWKEMLTCVLISILPAASKPRISLVSNIRAR